MFGYLILIKNKKKPFHLPATVCAVLLIWKFRFSLYVSFFGAGFLNANTDRHAKAPANYGLMDIIAALHWLQENIGAFGGDPQSVTLAGHGTGAACVHYLIASSAVPDGEYLPDFLHLLLWIQHQNYDYCCHSCLIQYSPRATFDLGSALGSLSTGHSIQSWLVQRDISSSHSCKCTCDQKWTELTGENLYVETGAIATTARHNPPIEVLKFRWWGRCWKKEKTECKKKLAQNSVVATSYEPAGLQLKSVHHLVARSSVRTEKVRGCVGCSVWRPNFKELLVKLRMHTETPNIYQVQKICVEAARRVAAMWGRDVKRVQCIK